MDNVILSQTTINGSGTDLGFTNPITVTLDSKPDDEENITKTLININIPKTTGAQIKDTTADEYGANTTGIIDLLNKVEQRMTINGYLSGGTVSGDSSSTALNRKKDLKKLFTGGGVINILYEGEVITACPDKISIRRIATDNNETDEGVAVYDVKLTLVKGDNYGG